jgi:hypothetical protein
MLFIIAKENVIAIPLIVKSGIASSIDASSKKINMSTIGGIHVIRGRV